MIVGVLIVAFALILLSELFLILSFKNDFIKATEIDSIQTWPNVSILIAARNEEDNLEACLNAVLNVDYPQNKFRVLIGNDQSTDNTQIIINHWINQRQNVKSIPIQSNLNGLIAKSNVLAQLAAKADGKFFVILDADATVTKHWLKTMVAQATQGFDLVSGYTEVKSGSYFSSLQRMDWQNSIHTLKVFSDRGNTLTALGNNMLISAEAYQSVGGFEVLGKTKVEDLKLLLAAKKMGLRTFQLIVNGAALTAPLKSVLSYVDQRKRWLSGIMSYRALSGVGFIIYRLMLVEMLIVLCLVSSSIAQVALISFLVLKLMIENIRQHQVNSAMDEVAVKFSLFKPFIIALLDTFALVVLVLNPKISWKKRNFK
ncbi:glycosyltransferase [Roseivirga sp.]|uniref:glycosyltransferase n=1 Tax=Roseivirga sp. TaxID=1964215 RepID=UPI002B2735A1|nr:glycosyltransferase [Roseivirga sp.]